MKQRGLPALLTSSEVAEHIQKCVCQMAARQRAGTRDGIDHFFHRSAIERTSAVPYDDLEVGNPVEFTPVDGPKGPGAIEVRPL